MTQKKPFNPTLGETYQAQYENGSQFFAEQTSNHPPICQFSLDDQDYTFSGSYNFSLAFKGNYMLMKNSGFNQVLFNQTRQEVKFNYPNTKISGIIFGAKTMGIEGTMTFEDVANNLKAVLFFQKQTFSGVFYHRDASKAAGTPSKAS